MTHISLENEKVGIVLATYNPNIDHFRQQLKSLQEQTFKNWCCYIIDDCSEDRLRTQIEKFCADEPRFKFIPNSYRLGVYRNFEKGLKAASEDVGLTAIAFCDQDDIWVPLKLERLLTEMRRRKASLIHSDLEIIDPDSNTLFPSCWQYEGRRPEAVSLELLLLRNTVTGCSLLFCSSLLEYVLPFPEQTQLLWYHDAWVAAIAAYFGKVISLREPLVRYRQHALNSVGAAKNDGSLLRELKLWIVYGKFRITGNTYLRRQRLADAVLTRINTLHSGALPSLPFSSQRRDFGLSVLSLGIKSCFLGCGATGVVFRATVGNLYLDLRKTLGDLKLKIHQLLYQTVLFQKRQELDDLLNVFEQALPAASKLFILHNDPHKSVNSVRGGTERHVADLIKYLSQSNPIFVLYRNVRHNCIFVRAFYKDQQLSLAFPIKRVSGSFYLSDGNPEFQEVLKLVIEWIKPSIIHIHHLLNLPFKDVYAVLQKLEIPYIVSLHDFYHICPSHNLISSEGFFCYPDKSPEYCSSCIQNIFAQGSNLKEAWWQANLAFLSTAQQIIAPSQTVLDYFQKEYPALTDHTQTVISHGVSDEIYVGYENRLQASALTIALKNPLKTLNIALVGHISPIKGAENISKVFDWVADPKVGRAINFYIFGTFQGFISPLAQDIVHLFGSYEHSELPHLLKQFHIDVVAIPSICAETYGLVADEVLSFGVPVITTPITAIAERVIRHRVGWVTRDCSAQALFETIKHIEPSSEEFKDVLANVQKYPISSTEQMVNRYAQVYETVLDSSGAIAEYDQLGQFSRADLLSAYLTAKKIDSTFREIALSPHRLPITKRWQIAQKLKRAYPQTWENFRQLAVKYRLVR
jgi:glycosyltransferase involved in cell wall biosynthesis